MEEKRSMQEIWTEILTSRCQLLEGTDFYYPTVQTAKGEKLFADGSIEIFTKPSTVYNKPPDLPSMDAFQKPLQSCHGHIISINNDNFLLVIWREKNDSLKISKTEETFILWDDIAQIKFHWKNPYKELVEKRN